jgi:hypothetical protein
MNSFFLFKVLRFFTLNSTFIRRFFFPAFFVGGGLLPASERYGLFSATHLSGPVPARNAGPLEMVQPSAGPHVSTFVSVRTLGFVRLLLSIPLVQLCAAKSAPCSLPRPSRASGMDSASLRPNSQQ